MNKPAPPTHLVLPTLTEVVVASEPTPSAEPPVLTELVEVAMPLQAPANLVAKVGDSSLYEPPRIALRAESQDARPTFAEATLAEKLSSEKSSSEKSVKTLDSIPTQVSQPNLSAAISNEQLIQHVMTEVLRQVDLVLEYRMREALAPLLARATENLIRETRSQLAGTLHEIVATATAKEIARHRPR
jgi:hypothetical protein